jgi:hypothetical protein
LASATNTLLPGHTYNIHGWTIVSSIDGVRFTYDGTGHGMFIAGNTTVDPF